MYNTKTFPTPPDSWAVIFQQQNLPDGKSNRGRCRLTTARSTSPTRRCSEGHPAAAQHQRSPISSTSSIGGAESNSQHALIHRYWHGDAWCR